MLAPRRHVLDALLLDAAASGRGDGPDRRHRDGRTTPRRTAASSGSTPGPLTAGRWACTPRTSSGRTGSGPGWRGWLGAPTQEQLPAPTRRPSTRTSPTWTGRPSSSTSRRRPSLVSSLPMAARPAYGSPARPPTAVRRAHGAVPAGPRRWSPPSRRPRRPSAGGSAPGESPHRCAAAADLPNHLRRPIGAAGAGWALVGRRRLPPRPDHRARHHRRLPRRGAAGRRPRRGAARPRRRGRALATYHARRDAALRETFDLTRALDGLPEPTSGSSSCRSSSATRSNARPSTSQHCLHQPGRRQPPPDRTSTERNHHVRHRDPRGTRTPQRRGRRGPLRHHRRRPRPAGARPLPVPDPARLGQRHPQPGHHRRLLRRGPGARPRAAEGHRGRPPGRSSSATTWARRRPSCCSTRSAPA